MHCYNSIGKEYLGEVKNSIETIKTLLNMHDKKQKEFLSNEYFIKERSYEKSVSKNKEIKSTKINTKDIYKEVSSNIIGQDEQIRNILSVLVRNNMTNNPFFKSNMLLIGGTGNGKTETIKQIAKRLNIPYVLEDSSKYTQEGYVGESVENAVIKLIDTCNGDISKAKRGIIIFDEIDKKTDNGDKCRVSTSSVQDSLLKIIEGTTIHTIKGTINTEFITFVFIGACENTFEERRKRLSGKGKIGFSNDDNTDNELKNNSFISQDLINSGFKSEFVGRIDIIQEFNEMDINMATKIINESKISIFDFYIEELKKLRVNIIMDREKVVQNIAKRAISLGIGARGIRQIIVDMFKNIYSQILIEDFAISDRYDLYISENLVYNNNDFTLCKKKIQN